MTQISAMTARLTGLVLFAGLSAWAGPPAICHPIEIGQAKSLPWGDANDFKKGDPNYDLKRLTPDTLALLAPGTPVRVRMETMRRAALYSTRDTRLALDLASKLMARALSAEASGASDAMAWFDAGYFVETLKQAALIYKFNMLSAEEKKSWVLRDDITGIDGFAWVQKALRMGGNSSDVKYALSLIDYNRTTKRAVVASK